MGDADFGLRQGAGNMNHHGRQNGRLQQAALVHVLSP
jgi:hypothetical protein